MVGGCVVGGRSLAAWFPSVLGRATPPARAKLRVDAAIVTYAPNAAIVTYAPNAAIVTYAPNAAIVTYAPNAAIVTYAPKCCD